MVKRIICLTMALIMLFCTFSFLTVNAQDNSKDNTYSMKNIDVLMANKISLNKTKVSLLVGSRTKLKLKNAKSSKIYWETSRRSIVRVNEYGTIVAQKAGKATITAKYNGKKYKCSVTVKSVSKKQKNAFNKFKKYLLKHGKQEYGDEGLNYIYSWDEGGKDYEFYYFPSKNKIYLQVYKYHYDDVEKAMFISFNANGGAYAEFGYNWYEDDYFASNVYFNKSSMKKSEGLNFKWYDYEEEYPGSKAKTMPNNLLKVVLPKFNSKMKKKAGVTLKELGFKNWDK